MHGRVLLDVAFAIGGDLDHVHAAGIASPIDGWDQAAGPFDQRVACAGCMAYRLSLIHI